MKTLTHKTRAALGGVASLWRKGAWRNEPCVFILSTGRTGTVTLIKLLDRSANVVAVHEPAPHLLDQLRLTFHTAFDQPQRYRAVLRRARAAALDEASRRGRIYVEATLLKFMAPTMAELLPEAKFLHLHRHPAAVVRSGMRRGWFDGHDYDRYKPTPAEGDPACEAWSEWGPFEKLCWLWQAENAFFLRLGEQLGPQRVLRISSERLLDAASGAYEKLFRFVGAAPIDPSVAPRLLSVRHNQQETGSFPPYDQWNDSHRRTLLRIAGPVMERLGYTSGEDSPCSG